MGAPRLGVGEGLLFKGRAFGDAFKSDNKQDFSRALCFYKYLQGEGRLQTNKQNEKTGKTYSPMAHANSSELRNDKLRKGCPKW